MRLVRQQSKLAYFNTLKGKLEIFKKPKMFKRFG